MTQAVKNDAKDRMEKAIHTLQKELVTIRAGRANPSMLDKIQVEYYGALTPLNQLANISTPDPKTLIIQPWDKSALGEVEKAILKSDLGITPTNDGNIIRITIPALTEERRKELVKLVRKSGEETKVAIRNVRRDANDQMKKLEKAGDISEDDARRVQDDIQKLTDTSIDSVDQLINAKEKEMMEI